MVLFVLRVLLFLSSSSFKRHEPLHHGRFYEAGNGADKVKSRDRENDDRGGDGRRKAESEEERRCNLSQQRRQSRKKKREREMLNREDTNTHKHTHTHKFTRSKAETERRRDTLQTDPFPPSQSSVMSGGGADGERKEPQSFVAALHPIR